MLFLAFFLFFVLLRYDKLTPKLFYLFTRQSAIKPVAKCNDHSVLLVIEPLLCFNVPLIHDKFPLGQVPANIPSATQWTSATDMTNGIIYYRTRYNSTIRSIDLRQIDFGRIEYHAAPLDKVKRQPIVPVKIE